jgi:hypothetical protein
MKSWLVLRLGQPPYTNAVEEYIPGVLLARPVVAIQPPALDVRPPQHLATRVPQNSLPQDIADGEDGEGCQLGGAGIHAIYHQIV